jgi:predicted PurR-regulated permease PerM
MIPAAPSTVTRADLYTWFFAVTALALVLVLHLLPALLAGLTVYELVHVLASRFGLRALGSERAKIVSVALIAGLVITLLTLAIAGAVSFLRHGTDSLPALLQKLADIIEATRDQLPDSLLQYLPADAEELRTTLAEWLRKHSGSLPLAGKGLALAIAHVLIGMVVGALLALKQPVPLDDRRPVARAVAASTERLGEAFRRVVFAQAWIAGINTAFTAIYLVVILPLLGVHLPLVKTLIAVTLIAGLMPIIGNLLSNAVIVLVSLSHSLPVALGSLGFLISVHKLEYFLNARIIGSHIRAQAWELLIAMVVMEAMFGIAGLIAAPIYYACVKDELSKKALI